jgi:hypothetical protein
VAFLALALAQSNGLQCLLQNVTKTVRWLVNSGLLHLEFIGNALVIPSEVEESLVIVWRRRFRLRLELREKESR